MGILLHGDELRGDQRRGDFDLSGQEQVPTAASAVVNEKERQNRSQAQLGKQLPVCSVQLAFSRLFFTLEVLDISLPEIVQGPFEQVHSPAGRGLLAGLE